MSSTSTVIIQMLLVASGLYASFFWWSLLQERVATVPYEVNGVKRKFNFPLVINTVQYFFSAVLGLALFGVKYLYNNGAHHSRWIPIPVSTVSSIGLTCSLASPFGYAAMKHISFPMVLTLKMCKMVPIAIVGAIVHRTRYSLLKYLDILLITGGVIGFMLLDSRNGDKAGAKGAAVASVFGGVLCFINLTLDGFTNSSQENVVKTKGVSSFQMMCVSNFAALLISVPLLFGLEVLPPTVLDLISDVFQPQLYTAFQFIADQPDVVYDVVLMGFLCALGQVFIFIGMETFGSLTTTAMTVTRKVGSVALSIIVHQHPVNALQLTAISVVAVGIFLDAYLNVQEKKKKRT